MTESEPERPEADSSVNELDLLVVGDINPDVIVGDTDLSVEFDQVEQVVERAALVLGGSAGITAVGASRLGLRVGICGVVGSDDLGELMVTQLQSEGVDVSRVRVSTTLRTGLSVILDRSGDRAILTAPGAISALGSDDLGALSPRPARHVHVASYFLLDESTKISIPGWFAQLRTQAVSTSIDTNWDPRQSWQVDDVLRSCDWYFPNEAELSASTGSPLLDVGLDRVTALGSQVAVKRGAEGGLTRSGDRTFRVRRTPTVEFVDAIGAGDTFNAAFLAGWLTGGDVGRSLAMAVAAGTLSTSAAGGTAAQPTPDELRLWADRLEIEEERS